MATLREKIDADLKDSMRAKTELRTSVLRMLKSAIKYKEVEPNAKPIDDAVVLQIIGTLIKQRREAADGFRQGGRADAAEKEEQEIVILQGYLPQQASAEDVKNEVAAAIQATGAKGPKDMGAVMKAVMPKLQGRAEGKAISDEVKAQLSKL